VTWVIGATTFSGCAIVVSDIQVTYVDEDGVTRYRDCLQKTYMVGNHIIGGFAGSVPIGFLLLQDLTLGLRRPKDETPGFWHVGPVAHVWRSRAREIFQSASPLEQEGGSEILLAGVEEAEPEQSLSGYRSTIVVMRAPEFEPELTKKFHSFAQIGSGSEVAEYVEILQDHFNFEDGGQIGGLTKGDAQMLADMLGASLHQRARKLSRKGISAHMHVHVLSFGEAHQWSNDTTDYQAHLRGERPIMPPVARSMKQLEEMLGATAARCAVG
jgi:hypothetical protein